MEDDDRLTEPMDETATAEQIEPPTRKLGDSDDCPPSPRHHELSLLPATGEIFASKYKLVEVLGQGAFARVYKAIQLGLDRTVAIKLLLPRSDSRQAVAARFWREAKILSRLKNSHTVTLYDFGELGDGALYMVFEFVPGTTLAMLLRNEGALETTEAESIIDQLLGSLEEAHDAGILHRDIKPANIMVRRTDDGLQATLVDFGIAKSFVSESELNATAEGSVIGTPRYMSPEQLNGQVLGPPSDLFSLAMVAFETLTGSPALESHLDILRSGHGGEKIALPPDVPVTPRLRRLIDSCLEPTAARRPQTAGDARELLYDDTSTLSPSKPITSRRGVLLAIVAVLFALLWTSRGDEEVTQRSAAIATTVPESDVGPDATRSAATVEASADINLLVGEVKSFGDFEPTVVKVENARIAGWTEFGRRAVLSGKRPGETRVTIEEGDVIHRFTVAVSEPDETTPSDDERRRLTLFEGTSLEFPSADVRRIHVGELRIASVANHEERDVFVVTGEKPGTTTLSLLTDETEDTFIVSVVPVPRTLFRTVREQADGDAGEVDSR